MTLSMPKGWSFLNGEASPNLQFELQREICQRHPLYGKKVTAIMRRSPFDEVLFLVEEDDYPFCLVRLSWAYEDDPNFPSIERFKSYDDFTKFWEIVGENDIGHDDE